MTNSRQRFKEASSGGFNAQAQQGPWAGQAVDPVSLNGPTALPMPVEVGGEEHFRDCFHFLAADKDPNDFYPGGESSTTDHQNENGLHPGRELI